MEFLNSCQELEVLVLKNLPLLSYPDKHDEYYEMMRGSSYGEYLDRDQVLDTLAAPRVVLDLNERPTVVIAKLIAEDHKRFGD